MRLFSALLLVALPPLVAFSAITVLAGGWLVERGMGAGTQLLIGAGITVGWAALVAGLASRLAAGEARSLVELVERGRVGDDRGVEDLSAAERRLSAALDDRNRQIAELAVRVREAPIAEDPAVVASSMVGVARSLTGDPIWTLAVLRSASPRALQPGVYGPDPVAPSEPVRDVHQWASTVETTSGGPGAHHAIGPWGAFVVVDVAAGEELGAILMAPWEGRLPPSPAELGMFGLLGQHAATAVEHALIYTRLRAQTDELNRMAAVQTDFLRGVTHDLQTPLTSIGALASEVRESPSLDAAARRDLDTVAHQADRLRRMVSQLLTVSRLEAGALTPRQEVFRSEPIIHRTWEALRAGRPMELTIASEPHLVVGDPDRFEQALWAVLDNAVKYSPAGSAISIGVATAVEDGGLSSRTSITDLGAGMDPEATAQAFDQFYRAPAARRMAPDGSGVGLYAARGLVRAMGGDLELASRLGTGTTVTIRLPAEAAGDEGDGSGRAPAGRPSAGQAPAESTVAHAPNDGHAASVRVRSDP
jgi:signal transduction histidine kinase